MKDKELARIASVADSSTHLRFLQNLCAELMVKLTKNANIHYCLHDIPDWSALSTLNGVAETARVIVYRKGYVCPPERHPNSTQFVKTLRGKGRIRVFSNGSWREDDLPDRSQEFPRSEWHRVDAGVIHQPVPDLIQDWSLVAFHSAKNVTTEMPEL